MLFWHKYNVAKSLADLPNFTPFPSEWTVEDKVLFEQAFSFHGKSFHRIRQMLPDKSISTLVRYYYQWKKTRTRTSLMDRHVRKLTSAQKDNDENESGENSNDSDFDPDKETQKGDGSKSGCSNCAATMSQLHTTPKGQFCNQCYSYWRRTGVMRVHTGPVRNESHSLRHHPVRTRKKPPKGMYINADDLMVMTNAAQSEIIFKELDTEMTNKKREVQYNKQLLSQQRNSMTDKFEEYRPQVSTQRNNVRWTNDELLLAVQAVRKYGKDYQAIADVVGNKNIQQCSSFLVNYRRRFNLDQVLEEYEADQAASNDHKNTESVLSEKQLPLPSQVTGMVANVPPPLLRPSHQPSPKTSVSAQSRFLQPPRSALQQLPPPLIRPASNLPPSQHRAHPAITGPLSRPPQLVGNQNPQESPVSQ
ncbi:REST corepressor 3-like [Anneissia japonica]|uniref:REST corepressor 3-like n=1 Tax=Anneissia japonica TaxID=1529436 RepID=UPI0014257319|nr:REST corepressor 3-like [Anneissia japonica]